MKEGRSCVLPGVTVLARCPPSSFSEGWPGPSLVQTTEQRGVRHRVCQSDLCHVDGQLGNSEERMCLSRPWGTSNNDNNYYLLPLTGRVLCRAHVTSLSRPNNPFQ